MSLVKKLFIFGLIFLIGGIKVASANYDINVSIKKCLEIQVKLHCVSKSKLVLKHAQSDKATPSLHLNQILNAFIELSFPQFECISFQSMQFFIAETIAFKEVFLQHTKKPPKLLV